MRLLWGWGLAVVVLPSALKAGVAFWMPALFGDHMVVQAGERVQVWGRDLAGTEVKVHFAGESGVARADAHGKWAVSLAPLDAGGPFEMDIVGSSRRTLQDVLVGEVWLGSGQSNMDLALRATRDRGEDIPRAGDPRLRLFTVERAAAFHPLDDVTGQWRVCDPGTAADFSAVAYYFGRDLRKALDRPVGLIASSWGGTPAEDWVPRAALDSHEPYKSLVASWDRDPARTAPFTRGEDFDLNVKEIRLVSAEGPPLELPVAGWEHNEQPGSLGRITIEDGALAYRGLIRGSAWATAERVLFAQGGGLPLDVRPYERVVFLARGQGRYTLALGQPSLQDGDRYASAPFEVGAAWKSYSVPLAALRQGGWGEPKAFTPSAVNRIAFNVQIVFWPELGGVAYNGMIAPLTRFPVRGVLWYQGESNAGRAEQYAGLLRLLVDTWRKAWGREDLAFLTVQLPGYGDADGPAGAVSPTWPVLRQAQQQAMDSLKGTGLAVALDLGEAHDIHPKNKKPLGRRLALLAQALVYGRTVAFSGPVPEGLSAGDGFLRLAFSHGAGLVMRGNSGFEVAGRDGVFHPAHARVEGTELLLTSFLVAQPRAARYAWSNDPAAVLYNGDGLPAAPFSVGLKPEVP